MKFLTPEHPDAFVDFPMKDIPEGGEVCNKCKGHGGWNLELNAYPLHGKENTPQNRHLFSHYRASCSFCWGYGYIKDSTRCPAQDKNNGHDFDDNWTCRKCGIVFKVDSSD